LFISYVAALCFRHENKRLCFEGAAGHFNKSVIIEDEPEVLGRKGSTDDTVDGASV
jgi:hypothetical protein